MQWIESIRPVNDWSLLLVTRQGTSATFGLGDHERQIESLRAALDHAGEKGYLIDTINLIPKYNIPITLRDEAAPPKAIPVAENLPAGAQTAAPAISATFSTATDFSRNPPSWHVARKSTSDLKSAPARPAWSLAR